MSEQDAIGVVRQHRWMTAEEQAARLEEDGITRIIVSLGGGKKLHQVSRDELARLTRTGTVIKFVWLFLLADPAKRPAHAIRTDLTKWMHRIEGRGGIIKDVDTGLYTENPQHRKAIIAVADDMITRHTQGKKSAANSEARKGRPLMEFSPSEMKDARAVWRNVKDYPTWDDAGKALKEVHSDFTVHRAFKLWKGRK